MCLMSESGIARGLVCERLHFHTVLLSPRSLQNTLQRNSSSRGRSERVWTTTPSPKKRKKRKETTSSPLARLTSHEDSPAVVRVSGAASVLPAVVHNPRGGKGVALLLEEAFGQTAERVLVLFPPPEVVLQRDAFGLRAVPDLHAHFGVCTSASTLLPPSPFVRLQIGEGGRTTTVQEVFFCCECVSV